MCVCVCERERERERVCVWRGDALQTRTVIRMSVIATYCNRFIGSGKRKKKRKKKKEKNFPLLEFITISYVGVNGLVTSLLNRPQAGVFQS